MFSPEPAILLYMAMLRMESSRGNAMGAEIRQIRAHKAATPITLNGKDPETGEYNYFDWCGLKVFHDSSGYGSLILAGPRAH